jgi:hypothetical protein
MNLTCMYFIVLDLVKNTKLIEQKLIFGYIIEDLIGDETNSVCTWLVC